MEDRMTAQQLKNSILQMAVQGKLVPQDPNDEPASVLLERIKKEKEELIKAGKIKKSKTESFIFRGADNLHYEQIGKEVRCIEDELPFEISDSWEWIKLGYISTYEQTKAKIKSSQADPNTWELNLEDIEKGGRLLQKKSVKECKSKGDKTIFHVGDILYSKLRPYLLKIMIADEDGICTSEIVPFRLYGDIYSKYVVYTLKSPFIDGYINSVTYGVKMPRAGTDTMINLYLPLPPLSEQHRIVAKLQELEPLIEKYRIAEEQLHELNSNIKDQLKKSILQYAIEGKLVPQDPNDEPASVLLERIREEKQRLIKEGKIKKDKNESIIFRRDNSYYEKINGIEYCIDNEIPFEIPNSWQWARLNNIGNWGAGATPSKSNNEYYSNGTIPWLLTGDLNDGYITNIPNHITELALEKTSVKLNPSGSVLIAMYGATIGKLGILTFPATTNQACCACLVYKPFYSKYLFFYLLANKRNFVKKGEGGAQPNISKEKIIKTLIAVPPLKEQIRIVNLLGKVI